MDRLYRMTSGGLGIYEAVEKDCPRQDPRRASKPDGSWLPKVGPRFEGAVSFWKKHGMEHYEGSGLRAWHESVCPEPVEVLLAGAPSRILYEDEFQVLCEPTAVRPFRIRLARSDDAPGIAQVHVQSWRETYAGLIPDDYLNALKVEKRIPQWEGAITRTPDPKWRNHLRVAESPDGQIVGFCIGGPARESRSGCDAELYAIYLLKGHQGSGVGSLLIRELLRFLKGQGFHRMMLWVLEGNPTIQFYERMGGKPIGLTEEATFGMVKRLEQAYAWELA